MPWRPEELRTECWEAGRSRGGTDADLPGALWLLSSLGPRWGRWEKSMADATPLLWLDRLDCPARCEDGGESRRVAFPAAGVWLRAEVTGGCGACSFSTPRGDGIS